MRRKPKTAPEAAIKKADDVLRHGADLFEKNDLLYGENYRKVGKIFDIMFPEGLEIRGETEWMRIHIFSWLVGKLTRYSANYDEGGHEDSMFDLAVYAAMMVQMDSIKKEMDGDA